VGASDDPERMSEIQAAIEQVRCRAVHSIKGSLSDFFRDVYENYTEYRWQPFSFVGRCLVSARNQSAPWKFYDWTDSVGDLWRYRGCIGHRPAVRGQPTAKGLDLKKGGTMNLLYALAGKVALRFATSRATASP
jgi:hypothetical protein